MARNIQFVEGEYYHVFNRGVEKRDIFMSEYDSERFLLSMQEFNTLTPIGSIFQNSFHKNKNVQSKSSDRKLVSILAYCLNPNHYHILLSPKVDDGVSKFMHRLGSGYTRYFNERYKRSGALFQGAFKAVHIQTDNQLKHVSAYINLNDKVHKKIKSDKQKLVRSSWKIYTEPKYFENIFCDPSFVLAQFDGQKDYKKFALDAVDRTIELREELSGELPT